MTLLDPSHETNLAIRQRIRKNNRKMENQYTNQLMFKNSLELLSFIFSLATKLKLFKGHIKILPCKLHSKKKIVKIPCLTFSDNDWPRETLMDE